MADIPRATVPVEPTEAMIEAACLAAQDGIGCTPWKHASFDRDHGVSRQLTRDYVRRAVVAAISAAPAPEGAAVDWSYDLTSCPRSEPFLIAYADGDVRMGHYLDNSKSSVPWEGIRPLFGAERWDAKIIAWAKRPALATREEAPAEAGDAFLSWLESAIGEASCDLGAAHQEGGMATEREKARPGILSDVRAEYLALRAQPPAREDAQPVAGARLAKAMWGVDLVPAASPAPDALRLNVDPEDMEHIGRWINEGENPDRVPAGRIKALWQAVRAALQFEQKGPDRHA